MSQFNAGGERAFAALEDCLTLKVTAYSPSELYEMQLRPVQAADGGVEFSAAER